MTAEAMESVLWIAHSRDIVLSRKSGKNTPGDSRIELEENVQTNLSDLTENDNTSNWLKDLPHFNTLYRIASSHVS